MAFDEAANLGSSLSGLFDKGWKKNIRPASFRGVPFYVMKSTTEIGRRTKVWDPTETSKKFKNYKKTIIQDIGQKANRFNVEGYIVQSDRNAFDYMKERDKLMEALTKKGPGRLIHPFYGEKWCGLADVVQMEESFEEGGICRFTIPFVEADEIERHPKKENALGLMDSIANSSILSAIDNFATRFTEAMSFAESLVDAVTGITNGILGAIGGIVGALSSVVNFVVNTVATLSTLIQSVLNAPCDIADAFKDMYESIGDLCGMNGDVFTGGIVGGCSETSSSSSVQGPGQGSAAQALANALGRDTGAVLLTGESIPSDLGVSVIDTFVDLSQDFNEDDMSEIPDEQKENIRAMIDLTKSISLIYCTKIAARVDFDSKEQLETNTKKMTDAFDVLLTRLGDQDYIQPINQIIERVDSDPDEYERENTGSEELFDIVTTVRSTFIKVMNIRKQELADEVTYGVPDGGVINTLYLAYDKYEDTDRTKEIEKRNSKKISHPAFLPAGEDINLLRE